MRLLIVLSVMMLINADTSTYTRYTNQCTLVTSGTSTTVTPYYGFWNNQQCVPCQTYCTCSTYQQCDTMTCLAGTVKSNSQCVSCPTGCATCSAGSGTFNFQCDTCNTNYQLINKICVKLAAVSIQTQNIVEPYTVYTSYTQPTATLKPCLQMDSSTSLCLTCPSGSFLNEYDSCETCISGCATCTARGTCVTCQTGYIWSPTQNSVSSLNQATNNGQLGAYYVIGAGSCVACSGNYVATCTVTSTLTCIVGYYLNNGTCSACSTGCTTCSNATTCTVCSTGYYLESGLCSACYGNLSTTSFSCLSCPNGKNQACDTCVTGYTLIGSSCILCSSSIQGCQICAATSSNTITCTTCQNNYYPVTTNGVTNCTQCPSNVLYCTFANNLVVPTQCVNGYLLAPTSTASGATNQCTLNTNACLKMVDISGNCSTCYPGSYLVNQKCITCASLAGCTACSVSGSSGSQVLNCTSCTSGNQTGLNYVLNSASNNCTACATGCLTCAANATCSTCIQGYTVSATTCVACTTLSCATCTISTSGQTCNTCVTGYFLTTSGTVQSCNACPSGCSACGTTGQTCTKCFTGFYLANGGCNYGSPYCAVNNDSGNCKTCMYGYRNQNGYCLPCIDMQAGFVCGNGNYKSGYMILASILIYTFI